MLDLKNPLVRFRWSGSLSEFVGDLEDGKRSVYFSVTVNFYSFRYHVSVTTNRNISLMYIVTSE